MHFAQICARETSETPLLDDKFLAGRQLVLDDRDRHEATLMNDLAVFLREQGRLSEAILVSFAKHLMAVKRQSVTTMKIRFGLCCSSQFAVSVRKPTMG